MRKMELSKRLSSDYGMVLVLIGLCALFSALTLKNQTPTGGAAVEQMAGRIANQFARSDVILVVGAVNKDSAPFAENLGRQLKSDGFDNTRVVVGDPRDLRRALEEISAGTVRWWHLARRMT